MKEDSPRPCPSTAAPAGLSMARSRDDVIAEAVRRMIEVHTEPPPEPAPPIDAAMPEPLPTPSPPPARTAADAPLPCGLSLSVVRGGTSTARRAAPAVLGIAARFLRRPNAPRILAAIVLLAVVIARPWFVVSLLVLALLVALIVFLSLGPDRTCELIAARYDRLHRRDAARAERLRGHARRLSAIASRIVARLPASWTTGLYLPDFEDTPAPPGMLGPDPFDLLRARDRDGVTPTAGSGVSGCAHPGSGPPIVRPRRTPPSAGRCTPDAGRPKRCRPG